MDPRSIFPAKNWYPYLNLANMGYNAYQHYSKNQGKKSTRSLRAPGYRPRTVVVPYRKSQKGRFGKVKGIKKQVAQLSRIAKADQGTLIFRQRDTFTASCSVNASSFNGALDLNTLTKMELVLAQLRYYDPSNPATLIVAPGATGSFQKDFFFDLAHHKITMRNNRQVPVRVRGYIFRVKEDTSIAPATAFTQGLADVGAPSATSALVYPTDSNQLMEIWRIAKSCNVILQPGQQKVMTITSKKFVYDPSISDSHGLAFQRSFDGSNFSVRVEGILGHDNTDSSEQGNLQGAIDVQIDSTWNVLYPAGADIKFIFVDDNSESFTNGGVVANKPTSALQAF